MGRDNSVLVGGDCCINMFLEIPLFILVWIGEDLGLLDGHGISNLTDVFLTRGLFVITCVPDWRLGRPVKDESS